MLKWVINIISFCTIIWSHTFCVYVRVCVSFFLFLIHSCCCCSVHSQLNEINQLTLKTENFGVSFVTLFEILHTRDPNLGIQVPNAWMSVNFSTQNFCTKSLFSPFFCVKIYFCFITIKFFLLWSKKAANRQQRRPFTWMSYVQVKKCCAHTKLQRVSLLLLLLLLASAQHGSRTGSQQQRECTWEYGLYEMRATRCIIHTTGQEHMRSKIPQHFFFFINVNCHVFLYVWVCVWLEFSERLKKKRVKKRELTKIFAWNCHCASPGFTNFTLEIVL